MPHRCANSSQISPFPRMSRKIFTTLVGLRPRSECPPVHSLRPGGLRSYWSTSAKTRLFQIALLLLAWRVSHSSAPLLIFPMAVEECHDPQDDCRCIPRTIVVGTVYVGTDSQSRDARSRQVSTNDLQRDMCRALWLSRTRIPALCLARLWQTLRPSEPRPYWSLLAFRFGTCAHFSLHVLPHSSLQWLRPTFSNACKKPPPRVSRRQLCASELIGRRVREIPEPKFYVPE